MPRKQAKTSPPAPASAWGMASAGGEMADLFERVLAAVQASPEARATLPAMRLVSRRWREVVDDSIQVCWGHDRSNASEYAVTPTWLQASCCSFDVLRCGREPQTIGVAEFSLCCCHSVCARPHVLPHVLPQPIVFHLEPMAPVQDPKPL